MISRRRFLRTSATAAVSAGGVAMMAMPSEAATVADLIERHRIVNAALKEAVDYGNRIANEFDEYEDANPAPYETSVGTLFFGQEDWDFTGPEPVAKPIAEARRKALRDIREKFAIVTDGRPPTAEEARRCRVLSQRARKLVERTYAADLAAYEKACEDHKAREAASGLDAADERSDALLDEEQTLWRELIAMPCIDPQSGRMKLDYLLTAWTFEDRDERFGKFGEGSQLDTLIYSLCGGRASA